VPNAIAAMASEKGRRSRVLPTVPVMWWTTPVATHRSRTDAEKEVPMSLGDVTFSRSPRLALLVAKQVVMVILLGFGLTAGSRVAAETATVDCNTGGAVGPTLTRLKPGDVLLVQGTCRENIIMQAGVSHVTLDGQGKGTIHAPDARQPAVQVLGREITIKGLTVLGGQFGIAINRGATAVVEGNTMQNAALSGLEVSRTALRVSSRTPFGRTSGMESWCSAVRLFTSASCRQAIKFHSRTSLRTTEAMGSWSCGPLPPASSEIRSAAIDAMA
jgi:hypothetical protein